ncbi:MAG: carbon storage regulator CsrA [Acidobacteria bacterium]|nr:carbon storage regulator CsrA [Acidobacteriota bacterium]
MLVLTRKRGERILVGDDIVITILEIKGDAIRIGVDAPSGVRIQRHEVVEAIAEANVAAAGAHDEAADLAALLPERAQPDS